MVLERDFQARVVRELRSKYLRKGIIEKNDANQNQGFPDISIKLFDGRHAELEFKRTARSRRQPNQPYYHDVINKQGSFCEFIDPSNEDEVLAKLDSYLQ